ncbi:MAG TPA: helix-turn-helix transcriptional regulator [Terracidiphilus sp.]|nr:helix-turn-helix transcriptional regulator [Terracidiphilus sp.]
MSITMNMPLAFLPSNDDNNSYFQGVWARTFGRFIRSARERAGLSVENAAKLANLDPRNWLATESGSWLPTTKQQLQLMAAAVDIDWPTMVRIITLCRSAWGIE